VGPISASMHSIREMPCGNRHGPKSRGSMIFGVLSMYYYSHEKGNLWSTKICFLKSWFQDGWSFDGCVYFYVKKGWR
jgi:hypothetical protein